MRARRLPFHDEYVDAGESAVLIDDRVVVLSALGTSILAALGTRWTGLEDVAKALLGEYGDPPTGADAHEATRRALMTLAEQGLVETTG